MWIYSKTVITKRTEERQSLCIVSSMIWSLLITFLFLKGSWNMQEIVPETEKWSTNSPKPTTSKPFIFPLVYVVKLPWSS